MASPTRHDMVAADLKALAMAMYVSEQKDAQEHLILLAIKTWTYLADYVTMAILRKLFDMTDKELEPYLRALLKKGWIVRKDNYLRVSGSGDPEYRNIKMRVAKHLNRIEETKRTK